MEPITIGNQYNQMNDTKEFDKREGWKNGWMDGMEMNGNEGL